MVQAADQEDGSFTIEAVVPRRSMLQRRTPGRRRGVRIVAANIDRVVVVGSAEDPTWDPLLIDRFLAVVESNQLPVEIALNKIDLVDDAGPLADPYRKIGYTVREVSASTGHGMAELVRSIQGITVLFTGSTGVGKSSLLNTIEPELLLKTQEVSRKTRTGRHTTVTAVMCPIRQGGFVIDTPGLRDVTLWGLERDEVERAFPEILEAASGCRFDDCRHGVEPECAVVNGVGDGTIASTRLESFRTLLADADQASRHWE
jgi:ribosome biogenesis GTPase